MTTTTNQRDHLIQDDVIEELDGAPQVKGARIGISVIDGMVTLSGEVDSYTERVEANKAALRVTGVSVVADDLSIRHHDRLPHTDSDIGNAVKTLIDWTATLRKDAVTATVREQVVTLNGSVPWNFQRSAAARLIRGVRGVDNQISLTPRVSGPQTSGLIKDALVHHALQDADAIAVSVAGSEVTLTGRVSTWAEKHDADRAAWASPHTSAVHNHISVGL